MKTLLKRLIEQKPLIDKKKRRHAVLTACKKIDRRRKYFIEAEDGHESSFIVRCCGRRYFIYIRILTYEVTVEDVW